VVEDAALGKRIQRVEKEPNAGHGPAAHVFVAPVDGSLWTTYALISPKDPVSCSLPEMCESRNVVPKTENSIAHSPFCQECAQVFNLRSLSCTVNT